MNPLVLALADNMILFTSALFLGILLLFELGIRFGRHRLALEPKAAKLGTSIVNGSIFSLLGLLVAFTFSGAAARFESRHQLVIDESNAIGTAWLRLDLLPAESSDELRPLLRSYLDSRIAVYEKLPDIDAALREVSHTAELQGELWLKSVSACRESGSQPANMLLLPALNQAFDIATTRIKAVEIHPPIIIFGMLSLFSLACAFLAGFTMAGSAPRSWIHMIGFAVILSVTIYVIIDLEHPRKGLIQVNDADRILKELRKSLD